MNERLEAAIPWIFVLGLLAAWELAGIVLRVPVFVLPRPSVVAVSLYNQFGPILDNAWATLLRTLGGFAIAVALGIQIGRASCRERV